MRLEFNSRLREFGHISQEFGSSLDSPNTTLFHLRFPARLIAIGPLDRLARCLTSQPSHPGIDHRHYLILSGSRRYISNLFAFSVANLLRRFVTINPTAKIARSDVTKFAIVLKILTAKSASSS